MEQRRILLFWLMLVGIIGTFAAKQLQKSSPLDTHYNAAVVEMPFAEQGLPSQRLEINLQNYLNVLQQIPSNVDILIFPESTLNSDTTATIVPDPKQSLISPCVNDPEAKIYSTFLVQLSCEARRLATYLVINLTEKEKCERTSSDPRPCSINGLNIYNTNVVFDREGVIISRYRKVHLYGEQKNTTLLPEFGIFDTDFDVRFGHFICFDILFYEPAQEMVTKLGISDFIYPTMWFSQLPFLTGVQFQAAWAFGNDVNLLAAGSSSPLRGTTGTGIHNGRNGTMAAVMSQKSPVLEVILRRVPKKNRISQNARHRRSISHLEIKPTGRLNQESIFLKRDYLDYYESEVLDFSQSSILKKRLCFNNTNFCCNFEIDTVTNSQVPSNSRYYTYRVGILDSWRNVNAFELNKLRNCAIFTCISEDIKDCGKIFPETEGVSIQPQRTFQRISIQGFYPKSTEYLLMPNTLKDDLMPLEVQHLQWTENEVQTVNGPLMNVTLSLKHPLDNLMTFAIYGNYYNGTDLRNTAVSAVSATALSLLLSAVLVMKGIWDK